MEITPDSTLAVLVYHYLLERCMADVAEKFAENCHHLQHIKRSPALCWNTPMRRLQEVLFDHNSLLAKMKRLLYKYHEVAPVPITLQLWDKVEYLMEYLYERATGNSTGNTVIECSTTLPCQTLTTNYAEGREGESAYQLEAATQQQEPPPMQQDSESGSQSKDTNQEIGPTSSKFEVLYVSNDTNEQLNTDTVVVRMESNEIVTDMQTGSVESFITLEDAEVAVGQQVEITTLLVEPEQPPSNSLPSLPTIEADIDHANVSANKENQEPMLMPPDSQSEAEQQNETIVHVMDLTENSPTTALQPEGTMAEANSTTPPKERPKPTKQPIDAEALEEWRRIRSINNRNFDDHIRQLNHQLELMNRMAEPKKPGTMKPKPSPKNKKCKTTIKPVMPTVRTTRSAQKQKVVNVLDKKANGTAKRAAAAPTVNKYTTLNDSDTTDFASSSDEDEDVKGMARRIKEYRKQQKHSQKKDKRSEEPTSQSNVFTLPSSLPQCRVNLIAGRSPRVPTVQRGLRNRTPSTSPVSTPVKLSKSIIDNAAGPSSSRVGAVRQQLLQSGAKVKELIGAIDHPNAAKSTSPQQQQQQPGPVALSPKNRRPVRACTVNRKTIVASTPLKQTVPNMENMVSTPIPSDREAESMRKSVSDPNASTESSIPETNQEETVDAGEAAIYAVLAQLHGDN
ncbi:uncharacterized protein LOC125771899 [Anopheles funestus]|uniref:uncharacterized protein LOC125771899 n=1 Tax=Anopheles funestus TaxID=62324 RepID=UPI0020C6BEB7|nr:uncharacterized protein LOC125771899 [Anopheles funestus]